MYWLKKNTLTRYFVLVLCVTFLPLGILTVVIAGAVVGISGQRINDSYETQFQVSLTVLEEKLVAVERELDDFVVEYLADLTASGGHLETKNYEMVEDLGKIQSGRSLQGVAYLYDKMSAGFYMKYNYDAYTFEQMKSFQGKILSRGFPQGTTRGWKLFYFDRTCFFVRTYSYAGYDVGFLVDMNAYMEQLKLPQELETRAVYVTDYTKIMEIRDGHASVFREGSWDELTGSPGGDRLLCWESARIHGAVAAAVPPYMFLQKLSGYLILLAFTVLLEILCVLLFWRMVKKRVVVPIATMNEALGAYARNQKEKYRITGIPENISWDFRQMFENFNEMAGQIEEGRSRESQLYRMTLDNLRLRMNPHMLMNSFNLIYSMAQIRDYEGIQKFSLCLVDYFRYILREHEDMVRVASEMEFVKSYLSIQKIRFPGRFSSVYTMAENAKNGLIPPLLIENFVENSVKYAMIPGSMVEILINIRREEDRLLISVTDTGRGIKPEAMSAIQSRKRYVDEMGNSHIGIYNCRKWMEYYYRGEGSIKVMSTLGEGTQIFMEMPYLERREETTDEVADRG